MPIARVEFSDGRIGRFEVPDGTTPEQAQLLGQQKEQQLERQQRLRSEQQGIPEERDTPISEQIRGGFDAAATIAKNVAGDAVAGLGGLGSLLTPPGGSVGAPVGGFAGIGAPIPPRTQGAGDVVRDIKEELTFQPQTPEGEIKLQQLSELVQPLIEGGRFIESGLGGIAELLSGQGLDRAVQTIQEIQESGITGERAFEITGSPEIATLVSMAPDVALALLGGTGAKGASKVNLAQVKGVGTGVADITADVSQLFSRQSPAKQRIAQLIQEGTGDIETAGVKLLDAPPARTKLGKAIGLGGPRVVKDKLAVDAINQGFDEGVIAAVKGASPADRKSFLEMVDVMQKGKKNARFALENRPSDVVGNLLMDRLNIVQKANRDAGKKLNSVAKSLKGQKVEFKPAIDTFIGDLDEMGIALNRNADGKLTPDFSGSDIEGLPGPESVINRIVRRLDSPKAPDAFELHRMKKFIDEQVTFGKNAEGLAGKTEVILKRLRRNIDQTLDTNFPKYDKVNTQFSETIQAIDSFQDIAGKKMDLTSPNAQKATGTLLRRLMSNAQSRVNLLDSVNEIEQVAKKFGGKLDDIPKIKGKVAKGLDNDLLTQVLFVDELDAVFGTTARTSLQGQTAQAIKTGVRAVESPASTALEAAAAGAERVRGINQQGAFDSIRRLLKSGQP